MIASSLSPSVWGQILNQIRRQTPRSEIHVGRVIARDEVKRVIWLKEFGTEAIPLFGHSYEITYHDTTETGAVRVRKTMAEPCVPKVGELVLIADKRGARQAPRCLGVLLSPGWRP